ncbi:MAG: cadmium-translocating P-type ATPase [Clostridium sp.]|nr:cadmium-translocating P-type ATPase [Clostridium sp.]
MNTDFTLQGLGCANCAAKIEADVKKLTGILSASVSFATSKLQIKTAGDYSDDMHQAVLAIVHRHEPDIVVQKSTDTKTVKGEKSVMLKAVWLAGGFTIFAVGMVLEYVFNDVLNMGINGYIIFALFAVSYLMLGTKVLVKMVRNLLKGQIFDENFLMGIATVGAFAIGEFAAASAVMVLYQVGEFFQELAVQKSKKRIGDLMDIRPDYANVLVNGEERKASPETVSVGDIIIVKPGEKIPLDGVVIEGEAMLDTSALTGESVPRKAVAADTVLSGCINQNGVLTIRVTQTFGESTVSKIIDLVENAANKKAPTETFITKFAKYYTPIVVFLGALMAVVPPLFFGGDWSDWIYRSLVFLVIACPCALVLSIPLGFFSGIGSSSKKGVLVKGGNYLEALANLDIVVFDKTGTLTKGVFKVTALQPQNGFSESELLKWTAHAETFSNHPIALSILKEYGKGIDKTVLSQYEEIAGHGVSVYVNGKTIFAGNEKLMKKIGIDFSESQSIGTKVYLAVDNVYAGCIVISDEIKSDIRETISALKALGVRKTVMLTGDTPLIAEAVANAVGIDEVYSSLLPQQKVEKVEMLSKQKQSKKTLAFVGDGINDAPVLAMADVGIAMGGLGSDAAIEASDVVLMTDEPAKLIEAVKVARFTRRIVWQNIVISLAVQFVFLFLGMIGVASIWEAVFADVGISLLAVFNSRRILGI